MQAPVDDDVEFVENTFLLYHFSPIFANREYDHRKNYHSRITGDNNAQKWKWKLELK